MFTGIVKLAQIDDYISPSQSCIQPKILKKSQTSQKASVSLNDCLACSGCITSAQSILVDQMSLQKFKALLSQQNDAFLIISPQSLISLSYYYNLEIDEMFWKLSQFFLNNFKSVKKLYSLSQAIQICHQLVYQQFISNNQYLQTKNQNLQTENQNQQNQQGLELNNLCKQDQQSKKSLSVSPIICSQCPGWVCYAQKTLSNDISKLMSKIKSPQQIMARLVKKKYGNNCKVITIMPCFDKKLQAIRFNIDQSTKQVDITIATNQVQNLLNQFQKDYSKQKDYLQNIVIEKTTYSQNQNIFLQLRQINSKKFPLFLADQSSNGYIDMILTRLKCQTRQQKVIKNSDFIQITARVNQKVIKMAKCYGFRNIQKLISLIKRNKCQYSYIEIMACPGGCYSGGGQIRYQNKKQKDLIIHFKQRQTNFINNCSAQQISQPFRKALQQFDFKANYKPIQKTFQSTVMNW